MPRGRLIWMIAIVALLAAACGAGSAGGGDSSTSIPDESRPPTTLEPVDGVIEPVDPGDGEPDPGTPLPEQPDAKIPRAMQPIADAAIADLAQRLGVNGNEITVAVAEAVVWPDGSLGCPQPGMAYIQVQVEGSRLVLVHDGTAYNYHAGSGQPAPFYCASPA